MIFLIRYDRERGKIESLQTYQDSDRSRAEDERLELEIALNEQGISHEIVLLEAGSEDDLRKTHRRYFENTAALTKAPGQRQHGC